MRSRVVLAYDVVDDRARGRLFRALKRYLTPVQKSVFEGRLRARELGEVESLIRRLLDLDRDSVRLYLLCPACAARIRHHGTSAPLPDPDAPLIL